MNMPKSRGLHAKIPSPKAIFIGFLLVTVKVLNSCVQKQYLPLSHFLFKKIYFCSSTSTLRFSRFLISSLISEMKASRPFWPSSPLKRLLTDTTPSSSSLAADYQHIRDLLQSVPHGSCSRSSQTLVSISARIPASFSSARTSLAIIHVFIGDRQYANLYRSQPGRECACKMLDQNTDETLDGTEYNAVDHDRTMFLAVSSDVLQLKALRQLEVKLNGTALPGSARCNPTRWKSIFGP